jgi:hypothetical protein
LLKERPALAEALERARTTGGAAAVQAAETALANNRALRFNNRLDAVVAGTFLLLVTTIVLLSVREWWLLLSRRKRADLHETPAVWLPPYAVAESKPANLWGALGLAFGLAKHLSGEAELDRHKTTAAESADLCQGHRETCPTATSQYECATERRFNGINRCC